MKIWNRDRASKYTGNVYMPSLLKMAAVDYKKPEHRVARLDEDPIAGNLVLKTAELITSRTPIFLDKSNNELDKTMETWEDNLYNRLFKEAIESTRTHGYIACEVNKKPVGDRTWIIHDSLDIQKIKYSDLKIESYTILPKLEGGAETSIIDAPKARILKPDKVIHYYVGKYDRSLQGLAIMKRCWHALVRFTEIFESMAMYDSRIGNGILLIIVDPEQYTQELNSLHNAVRNLNNRRYIILKTGVDQKPPDAKFLGSNSPVDFSTDLETCLKVIAGASGFPVRYLIGDPKGALSAAGEDTIAVWENLKSIFGEYKDFIRKVISWQEGGEALNEKIAKIEFDDGGHLPEVGVLPKSQEEAGLNGEKISLTPTDIIKQQKELRGIK
ncbi:MAG: portal protein [Lokiarchaeia virus VerdaV1]|uniref:Portal protein n=1 Tax=Lokiarchaeia virus VerdaV1 TaxID=3070170 RepID=A0AA35CQT4_9CAUD|nr:MAG: portal protein [Lokiarchaeia virus VerdaV1]BDI54852.1 MAG: portal protein [Lokiarchaeia virus VerdaV1]